MARRHLTAGGKGGGPPPSVSVTGYGRGRFVRSLARVWGREGGPLRCSACAAGAGAAGRALQSLACSVAGERKGRGVATELGDGQAQLQRGGGGGGGDGGALGRPHVARALVDCGACDDIGDAFRRYLGRGRAAYVEKPLPRLTDVTELVHDVGGLTVAAHLGDHGTEGQIRV